MNRAGFDSFVITMVVIAIAALSNWLQHRSQSREGLPKNLGPEPLRPPRPKPLPNTPPPVRPSLESTLERELRRLLGEEDPPAVQPPPTVAPRSHLPEHQPTRAHAPAPQTSLPVETPPMAASE